MKVTETQLEGVLIIEPKVFFDGRGYFFESYSKRLFDEAVGREINFVQDNQSKSTRGVVRGLHFQRGEFAQAKLVRCIAGRVLDVVVDICPDSPTFGKHVAVELNDTLRNSLFIPRGYAHGFSVLSDEAVFQYKCDNYYCPKSEGGIFPLDPALNIDWRIDLSLAVLSEKDLGLPLLKDLIQK